MSNLKKFNSSQLLQKSLILCAGVVAAVAFTNQVHAGGDRIYFSSGSSAYKTGNIRSSAQRGYLKKTSSASKYSSRNRQPNQNGSLSLNYSGAQYKGPLVINVPRVHARKRLKVISATNRNPVQGLDEKIIDDRPGGVRVIYYSENRCNSGYDCIIRLGNTTSAPKIIIVGPNRDNNNGPLIIYPPS